MVSHLTAEMWIITALILSRHNDGPPSLLSQESVSDLLSLFQSISLSFRKHVTKVMKIIHFVDEKNFTGSLRTLPDKEMQNQTSQASRYLSQLLSSSQRLRSDLRTAERRLLFAEHLLFLHQRKSEVRRRKEENSHSSPSSASDHLLPSTDIASSSLTPPSCLPLYTSPVSSTDSSLSLDFSEEILSQFKCALSDFDFRDAKEDLLSSIQLLDPQRISLQEDDPKSENDVDQTKEEISICGDVDGVTLTSSSALNIQRDPLIVYEAETMSLQKEKRIDQEWSAGEMSALSQIFMSAAFLSQRKVTDEEMIGCDSEREETVNDGSEKEEEETEWEKRGNEREMGLADVEVIGREGWKKRDPLMAELLSVLRLKGPSWADHTIREGI